MPFIFLAIAAIVAMKFADQKAIGPQETADQKAIIPQKNRGRGYTSPTVPVATSDETYFNSLKNEIKEGDFVGFGLKIAKYAIDNDAIGETGRGIKGLVTDGDAWERGIDNSLDSAENIPVVGSVVGWVRSLF